jgi:hypothetical protein
LVEHFSLASAERRLISQFRGRAHRHAVVLLLKCLPYPGYFPRTLRQIPAQIRTFVSEQLDDQGDFSAHYVWTSQSRERHWIKIRRFTGWRSATKQDKILAIRNPRLWGERHACASDFGGAHH